MWAKSSHCACFEGTMAWQATTQMVPASPDWSFWLRGTKVAYFRFYTNHDAMCNVHIVHDPAMPSVLMCNIYQELYSVLAVSSLPHSAPLKSAWRAWLEPGSKISMNKSSKIDRRRQHHHQHHTTTPGTTSNARYCAMWKKDHPKFVPKKEKLKSGKYQI